MTRSTPTPELPLKIAVKYTFVAFFITIIGGFLLSKVLLGGDSDRGGYITAKMVPYVSLGGGVVGYLVQLLRNRRFERESRATRDDAGGAEEPS